MLARPTPFARFEAARSHDTRNADPTYARSGPRRDDDAPTPALDRHSTILPIALRTPLDRQALDPPDDLDLWCEGPDLDVDDDFAPSRDTVPMPPDEHELPTVRP